MFQPPPSAALLWSRPLDNTTSMAHDHKRITRVGAGPKGLDCDAQAPGLGLVAHIFGTNGLEGGAAFNREGNSDSGSGRVRFEWALLRAA